MIDSRYRNILVTSFDLSIYYYLINYWIFINFHPGLLYIATHREIETTCSFSCFGPFINTIPS